MRSSRKPLLVALAATVLVTMLSAKPASAQATVRVFIDSPVKATLERDGVGPVCAAPCDVDVPVDGTYRMRVAGERETSAPFELRVVPGWSRLTLKFDPDARTAHSGAYTVMGVGAFGILGGITIMGLASSARSFGGGVGALLGGGALAGAGLLCVLIGGVWAATRNTETVKQSAELAAHGVHTAWRQPEPTNRAEPASLVLPSLRLSF